MFFAILILSASALNAFDLKMLEVGILFDQQIFMYSRVVRKLLLSVHSDISSGDNMTRKSGTNLKCEFSIFWGDLTFFHMIRLLKRKNDSFFRSCRSGF